MTQEVLERWSLMVQQVEIDCWGNSHWCFQVVCEQFTSRGDLFPTQEGVRLPPGTSILAASDTSAGQVFVSQRALPVMFPLSSLNSLS